MTPEISPEDEKRIREDQRTRDLVEGLMVKFDTIVGLVDEVRRQGRLLSDLWQWRQDVEEAFQLAAWTPEMKAAARRQTEGFLRSERRRSTWWRRPEIIIPSITGLVIGVLSGAIHLPRIPWP